jgi:hypothetical protein
MSERNVELHCGFYTAFNARDIDAVIELCDPGVELHSTFAAVGGGLYHGHDGAHRWHRDLQEAWGEEIHIDVEAYFDLGENTLASYLLHGRGRHSQLEVAMPSAGLARWRDGLMVCAKGYAHRAAALSELGVAGDELEPIAP